MGSEGYAIKSISPQSPPETISVVIPCYNHGRFLAAAIESVLRQSVPPVEIIVVDDGSNDDTATVAARYPGVRYIRHENRGLAAARNTGLRQSVGAFLVFLDADDVLLPGALDHGREWLHAHPDVAFVSGHFRVRAGDVSTLAHRWHQSDPDPYLALLQNNYITMHGAVMYRRAPLESVGGFDTTLRACEDYDLYLRIARHFPIGRHHAVVAEYRQHGTNMSADPALMLDAALTVLRAQRPVIGQRPRARAAYRRGIRFWRDLYGALLIREILHDLRCLRWRRAARGTFVLAHHDPLGTMARIVTRYLFRGARRHRRQHGWRSFGRMNFGTLRSVEPLSRQFGYDRGQPIDRLYIEGFLARHAHLICGHVLEIGDDAYTRTFGGDRVTASDILHVPPGSAQATVIADLSAADHLPANTYDCVICTQTLHLIYDTAAAIRTLSRILRPGGALLATVPGISQIADDVWGGTWYWSFTSLSVSRLMSEAFPPEHIAIETHGNVLAATAFLHGLAAEELDPNELNARDPQYQLVICAVATKAAAERSDG